MKPRRWYSSPEVNPTQQSLPVRPFPAAIYWMFTRLTRHEQGAIIKGPTPPLAPQPHPKATSGIMMPERPRRINAA
ncbi:hypothetical protein [Candidatus Viridilinea mediisalina]|uniref:Uncharacterized protein n=1 Tax=Candidatus Viridilinea mediisalina TaxID=2024553 RepID=A0A2A6RPN0_9CHLR|nr:hypothetical protein [Candidatus Viridilinea mediisalina]PDW04886.1 hypothetical protein CJ255_01385 [Candidatus Viridilinea mediisalina]